MGEMEAELQKANNKVCHTGHQLNQLTAKVKTQHTIYCILEKRSIDLHITGDLCSCQEHYIPKNKNQETS